jgi:hypothetical protein
VTVLNHQIHEEREEKNEKKVKKLDEKEVVLNNESTKGELSIHVLPHYMEYQIQIKEQV